MRRGWRVYFKRKLLGEQSIGLAIKSGRGKENQRIEDGHHSCSKVSHGQPKMTFLYIIFLLMNLLTVFLKKNLNGCLTIVQHIIYMLYLQMC